LPLVGLSGPRQPGGKPAGTTKAGPRLHAGCEHRLRRILDERVGICANPSSEELTQSHFFSVKKQNSGEEIDFVLR
jgi:hypothetical protein